MDFETCYQLLASRPAHAHEHCVDEQHTHAVNDVQAMTDAVASDLTLSDKTVTPQDEASTTRPLPTVTQLGREFFALQERRVQIYRDFQDGFDAFKATPQFQSFCTAITMQFATVSQHVNAIEAALRQHQRTTLAQLVRHVQVQEKEKLLLTSALFVEKMRLADTARRAERDESTVALLEKSVATMTTTHTDILVRINELLDELRMELLDEPAENDDNEDDE